MAPLSRNRGVSATMTRRVGGPVSGAWRECVLTRATELVTLSDWTFQNHRSENIESLANAVKQHLDAAKEAACRKKPFPCGVAVHLFNVHWETLTPQKLCY
jgi:hypothetical protein